MELSDLDAERLGLFASTWEGLSPDRRQILLEELGLLADAQIELTTGAADCQCHRAEGDCQPSVALCASHSKTVRVQAGPRRAVPETIAQKWSLSR